MSVSRLTQRSRRRTFMPAVVWILSTVLCSLSAAAEPVDFSVLSYNTHGLPAWIARDQPDERFPQIAKLAATYDVALFQENFVDANFRELADGLPGRFLQRGNGSRAGWFSLLSTFCGSCGSGLTAAVDPRFKAELLDRKGYGSCSGWVGGANDCWATKGYLATRLRLTNGTSIDIYDLHLDAGDGQEDHEVRSSQLEVLRAEISRMSDTHAVIVAGDFNLDPRTPRDRILLDRFAGPLQLVHSDASGSVTKWTEQIDHILYRSSQDTKLQLLSSGEAKEFIAPASTPLSDHPAVFARFEAQP